ncbi:MAG: glycosyltransferase family 2 protein [Flavobacteriales bacterium]|nr:glycosyltransferase family 2 protein [Flavobacteriales bacterium]
MSTNIDISILILCYNAEKFLDDCLLGVFNQQTEATLQLVFMDDCSTDMSFEFATKLIKSHRPKFVDIQLIQNPKNLGCFLNMKKGLSFCTGKYIAYLEADDYWTDINKLEYQWQFLRNNPNYSGIGGGCQFVDEEGNKIEQKWYNLKEDKTFTNKDLWGYPPFQTSTFMFEKNEIANMKDNMRETISNDKILYVFLSKNKLLKYEPSIVSNYRFHQTNISHRFSRFQIFLKQINVNTLIFKQLGIKYSFLYVKSIFKYSLNYVKCLI